jgi:hypothetical protein
MRTRRVCNCLLVALVLGQVIGGAWCITQAHRWAEETSARLAVYVGR